MSPNPAVANVRLGQASVNPVDVRHGDLNGILFVQERLGLGVESTRKATVPDGDSEPSGRPEWGLFSLGIRDRHDVQANGVPGVGRIRNHRDCELILGKFWVFLPLVERGVPPELQVVFDAALDGWR